MPPIGQLGGKYQGLVHQLCTNFDDAYGRLICCARNQRCAVKKLEGGCLHFDIAAALELKRFGKRNVDRETSAQLVVKITANAGSDQ